MTQKIQNPEGPTLVNILSLCDLLIKGSIANYNVHGVLSESVPHKIFFAQTRRALDIAYANRLIERSQGKIYVTKIGRDFFDTATKHNVFLAWKRVPEVNDDEVKMELKSDED